ncbi:hypothetical protein H1230_13370 [Paenibacillus sp. 19GGS1-52]|uniref:phage tail tube protein n=1 Tax=Paenibacillus sp. 19GGS1-52 TaxID=2758563 RepID=UPI001EFAFE52|nr:phage tail tube protein [Paenibacillus sp. 19GGS1-52]ULO09670.1 hypothetical protein H1230_13370 [Paenibacillus sp. 19GGS1-52]
MANKGNEVATGTNTVVWVNGEDVKSNKFEYKVAYETADVKFGGDLQTYKRVVGVSCEGSFTINRTQSRMALLIGDVAKTGLLPDITITSKIINDSTGKAERATFRNVVIAEYGATSENQAVMEDTIPFTSSPPEFIEYM